MQAPVGRSQAAGGFQQRIGVGFGASAGVAADHAAGSPREAERLQQWIGESRELVRHHTPGQAVALERVEKLDHALEQPGVADQVARIQVEELVAHGVVAVLAGREAEARRASRPRAPCDTTGRSSSSGISSSPLASRWRLST